MSMKQISLKNPDGSMRSMLDVAADYARSKNVISDAEPSARKHGVFCKDLTLPWPSRTLHPNSRAHWGTRSKAARYARAEGYLLAREAGWHLAILPLHPIHLWIDGYPTDKRRRDADGLLSSLKAAIDGIADCLGIDDRYLIPHPRIHDEVRKGGEVRLRITTEGE